MDDHKRHGAEKLRVYWLALDFARGLDRLIKSARLKGNIVKQLIRAAESVIGNIAEGAAHLSPGKKLYHFQVAHGEAGECIGILHRLEGRYGVDTFQARRSANMIGKMLMALIKAQEKRRDQE